MIFSVFVPEIFYLRTERGIAVPVFKSRNNAFVFKFGSKNISHAAEGIVGKIGAVVVIVASNGKITSAEPEKVVVNRNIVVIFALKV